MVKKILTMNNALASDFNTAKDQLIDFTLKMLNGEISINEQTLENILPAFYSYGYHKHLENGVELGDIHYYMEKSEKTDAVASATGNSMTLYSDNFFSSKFRFRNIANLFITTFHETQHIADNFDKSKKSTTLDTPKNSFYTTHFTNFIDFIENTYASATFFKISNPVELESNKKSMADFAFSSYFFDEEEVNARATGSNFTKNLIEYAKRRPDIANDEYKLNLINGLEQEVLHLDQMDAKKADYYSTCKFKDEYKEIYADHIEKELNETQNLVDDMIKIKPDNESETELNFSNKFEALSNTLKDKLNVLASSQHFIYNENTANQIGELILTSMENKLIFENDTFSYLIKSSNFVPSEEQMERVAKCYQSLTSNELYNNMFGLTQFIEHFNCYSQELLLPLFSKNNPNFEVQVEMYESELYPLDESVLDTIKSNESSMGE